MNRFSLSIMLSLLVVCVSAFAQEKVETPMSCQKCGASRISFAQSRMLIVYVDGTAVGTCCLHCTASAMHESHGRKVASVKVANFKTGKLVDVKTAVWVIGCKNEGVLSSVAQLAFVNNQEAQEFVKRNGGKVATFEQALILAKMNSTMDMH